MKTNFLVSKYNINDSFFGYVIRSVCIDMIRKKKIDTIPFYDNLDAEDIEPSTTTDITDVLFTLDNWTWDEKLFYLKYIEEESEDLNENEYTKKMKSIDPYILDQINRNTHHKFSKFEL